MQQNNMNANVGVTNPNSGAVYTSEFNSQQGPGTQAGAVYTSGMNTSGMNTTGMASNTGTYNNYNQRVGSTDPNSGAVYTSGINQQGPGNQAGAVYTSGANTQGMQSGFMNQGNIQGQSGMGYSNAGAVYTSGINQQQGPGTQAGAVYTSGINQQQGSGTQAGAVYTSGINTSGSQSNFNNQRNSYGQVGMSDPNSGAVYTSGTNQQQGLGAQAGAVYTSGTNNYGMSINQSSNVQQIKQQLQNMQSTLRQTQSFGYEGEIYVDVANRLQDAYELLNQNRL